METHVHIGELAELVGASPRSLRYYEKQGLLEPSRDPNGYRRYDGIAMVRARNIRDLLDVGLTTDDIRHYTANGCLDRPLADAPRCSAELETAHRRLAGLDDRIERLQRLRERLARHGEAVEASVSDRNG